MARILGVDPGLGGGLVMLDASGKVMPPPIVDWLPMPTVVLRNKRREVDIHAVARWLSGVDCTAFLEQVWPRPKQGVAGMFRFGCGYGMLRGLFAGLDIPCILVSPRRWTTLCGKIPRSEFARRVWPEFYWCVGRARKPHSGLVDAALIALWACHENFLCDT